jgi:hypothetical protein
MSNYIRTLQLLRRIEDKVNWLPQHPEFDEGLGEVNSTVRELRALLEKPERDEEEREFTVTWGIPLTSTSAIDAAITARDIHRDEGNIATVYEVEDCANNERVFVDLGIGGEEPHIVRKERIVQ